MTADRPKLSALLEHAAPGRGPAAVDPTAWLAAAPPAARDLLLARALVMTGENGPEAEQLLARTAATDSSHAAVAARLLLVELARADGAPDACERFLELFRMARWPVPAPSSYHATSGGVAGIRSVLESGAPLVIDRLLGLEQCARVAAEIDRLDRDGLLHGGGFYSPAAAHHEGRCDKRRAQLAELHLRRDLELTALTELDLALLRVVAANNYYEGTAYYPLESQIATYPGTGARYDMHTDETPGGRLRRRVTLLYYASPGWRPRDGGILRIESPAGLRAVEPHADRVVVFASHWNHEVTPCHRRRRSFTSWCWSSAL